MVEGGIKEVTRNRRRVKGGRRGASKGWLRGDKGGYKEQNKGERGAERVILGIVEGGLRRL